MEFLSVIQRIHMGGPKAHSLYPTLPTYLPIYLQVADGLYEDAEQQMEFLSVIQESMGGPNAHSLFLQVGIR